MAYTTELIPNLNRLIASKNAIVAKLKAVGVAVPDGATLEQLSALIPSGGGGADAAVTVTAATLFNGETARDKDGNLIIGTALATTTTAGLYDVGKGKTFYNHYGELCTGLGDFTPAESVAAMQQQIDAYNQKLMQITAEPEAVLQGYTAMGADGELFQGVAKSRELITVEGSWSASVKSKNITMTMPFADTEGFIYVVSAHVLHYTTGGSSYTKDFLYLMKDGVLLNGYDNAGTATTMTPTMNMDTGVFTVSIDSSGLRTDVKPRVTHYFAYIIK